MKILGHILLRLFVVITCFSLAASASDFLNWLIFPPENWPGPMFEPTSLLLAVVVFFTVGTKASEAVTVLLDEMRASNNHKTPKQ